ncbi:MAG: hypothetical protein ACE5NJ_12055, partial [Thermodesulfobacteriota bacterium]
ANQEKNWISLKNSLFAAEKHFVGERLRKLQSTTGIDNWSPMCLIYRHWRTRMLIKLISRDNPNPEEFEVDGGISSQTLADGLIHLHEEEPTTSELVAQMIYEDIVKNR